jgi:hypothetical protein
MSHRGQPGLVDKVLTIIPALGRLRWEDLEFKVILGYIRRPCLKQKQLTRTSKQKVQIEQPSQVW